MQKQKTKQRPKQTGKMKVKNFLKKQDKIGGIDLPLLAIVMLLLLFGLVMLFSASYPYSLLWHENSYMFISPQIKYAIVGVVVMFVASRVNYSWLKRWAWPLMLLSITLLVVVLFMAKKNDARRWIWFNSNHTISIQPSEIAKFAVILLFAAMISNNKNRMKSFKHGFLPFMIILAILSGLLVLEPHMSCTLLILGIGISMMFAGGTPFKWFFLAAGICVVGVYLVVTSFPELLPHIMPRIKVWLDPFNADKKMSHQVVQSIIAVGSGGITGRGIGRSVQKFLYLPEMYNDYIFAVICEELGFIGAVAIILLFLALFFRGLYIAFKAKDKFGSMLALGISVQIVLQAFVHIAVNINAIPSTGISMPFFSSGGSSLVMILGQVGILLSVSRQAKIGDNALEDEDIEQEELALNDEKQKKQPLNLQRKRSEAFKLNI